jgi:6-pyruvoyltetrahydropterin/6-carboxytetrahydropterin synthase
VYTISKRFTFDASHQLTGLREGHKCMRLHGHTYTVELELQGTLNANGFVVDYDNLKPFKEFIDNYLDHRDLNEALKQFSNSPSQPSAENLAAWLYDMAVSVLRKEGMYGTPIPHYVRISAVRVQETPNTSAEYRP